MQEIKINKIYHNTTKQDGTKYVDKRGKAFTLITVYTTLDGKEVRMSCLDYDNKLADWKEGDVKTVKITQNGEYLNFSPPSGYDLLEQRISKIEARIEELEKKGQSIRPDTQTHAREDERGQILDVEPGIETDLPFAPDNKDFL